MTQHLISWVVFLPLVFAAFVALLPSTEKGLVRAATFLGMVVSFGLGLWLYFSFDPAGPEFQLEERARWIEGLGIGYHVGVDGLAASLMLLTTLLGPIATLASVRFIDNRVKEFHVALLVLQSAMLGALASLDLILFYVFWEAMLIPMYLIIGVWGSEERQMAAVKFFLYTLVGSLVMLVAILAVYFVSQPVGPRSFDFATIYNALLPANKELAQLGNSGACGAASAVCTSLRAWGPWLFLFFAVAFAVKVPLFPFHTWLPDAHVQAPAAGSIILAGVMLKMGTFGFWRYAVPLFPNAARDFQPLVATLAVAGIVYGALMCLAQRDVKKLIAYSSVSHLGFCMLGIFAITAEGATGSAYQMLNHGISTGALFLLFGMLYERRHTRLVSDFGGIARVMPVFAVLFLVTTFSSIAVPGTNGFVGEFLVLLGTFKSSLRPMFGVAAALGVILSAAYMLWLVQRVFFGPITHQDNQALTDVSFREVAAALPLVVVALLMGLYPQPFLERLQPASDRFVARATVGQPGAVYDERLLEVKVTPEAPAAAPAPVAPVQAQADPTIVRPRWPLKLAPEVGGNP